ncbi:Uncharacterized protein TPAR_02576, partial [Tolypocladium paradoxum]
QIFSRALLRVTLALPPRRLNSRQTRRHHGFQLGQAVSHEAGPRRGEPGQRPSPHRETPGKLLRQVRAQTRQLPLQRRADVHDDVHGKVHGGVEPGQLGLHQQDTTGAGQPVTRQSTLWRRRKRERNAEYCMGCTIWLWFYTIGYYDGHLRSPNTSNAPNAISLPFRGGTQDRHLDRPPMAAVFINMKESEAQIATYQANRWPFVHRLLGIYPRLLRQALALRLFGRPLSGKISLLCARDLALSLATLGRPLNLLPLRLLGLPRALHRQLQLLLHHARLALPHGLLPVELCAVVELSPIGIIGPVSLAPYRLLLLCADIEAASEKLPLVDHLTVFVDSHRRSFLVELSGQRCLSRIFVLLIVTILVRLRSISCPLFRSLDSLGVSLFVLVQQCPVKG